MAQAARHTLHRLTQAQCDAHPFVDGVNIGLKADGTPKAVVKIHDGGGLYHQLTPTRIVDDSPSWNS